MMEPSTPKRTPESSVEPSAKPSLPAEPSLPTESSLPAEQSAEQLLQTEQPLPVVLDQDSQLQADAGSHLGRAPSLQRRVAGLWQGASNLVPQKLIPKKLIPKQLIPERLIPQPLKTALARQGLPKKLADQIADWFSVSETQMAEILATVRSELPTTEALLVGKPQAGKSSIVRGLTGVSSEIIGEGFRPHTQHTERYAYPSEELPLLIFTDTVGLGDIQRETESLVEELAAELRGDQNSEGRTAEQDASGQKGAQILILTVKINDFATETLRVIAQQLRKQYPEVPCLLAVTCLHELYPTLETEHPEYPPETEAIARAFETLKQDFAGLYDGAVLLDFTLEEDGYEPMFYGLEALQSALAELLPEAESRAIAQLVAQQDEMSDRLGDLYRDVGRRYISAFAVIAATLAAVPLPFATMPVLTALQVSLVGLLGKLYGQVLSPSQAGGVVSAIAGGFLAQAIGRELVKFIPGLGSVIAASWAAAYTWALGEGACVYFGDLMGGKNPDPDRIQQVMGEAFTAAKARFKAGGFKAE